MYVCPSSAGVEVREPPRESGVSIMNVCRPMCVCEESPVCECVRRCRWEIKVVCVSRRSKCGCWVCASQLMHDSDCAKVRTHF